jgi:modulator of FtsH protease HflK
MNRWDNFDENPNSIQKKKEEETESELSKVLNTEVPKWIPRTFAGAIAGIMTLTSFYIVSPSEEGVVTRFGKYNRTTESGLNFKLPWPIEKSYTPEVSEVKRLELGFRTTKDGGNGKSAQYDKVAEESVMLTGDENIVQSEFIVQYKIKNARDYLFNVKDPVGTLRDAAEAAHRQVIGDNGIDEALTTGKTEIQNKTKEKLQEIIDRYKMGVQVVSIQLQDVYAPEQVANAFKDVASAKEDKVKYINDAKGRAQEMIREAEAYKQKRIDEATGNANRFLEVHAKYKLAPKITEERMYIESMEKVYPNLDIYMVSSDGAMLKLLDLQKGKITGESK